MKPKARKLKASLNKLELQMRKVSEELNSLVMPYGEKFKEKADEMRGAADMVQEWNESMLEEMK